MRKLLPLLCAVALVANASCQPIIFASSDSPDRKYRCEVIRVRSKFAEIIGRENWRYDFNIRYASTGQGLPGDSFVYGDEEIHLDEKKLEFKWSSNQLVIVDQAVSPAREFLTAALDSTGQHWKQTN